MGALCAFLHWAPDAFWAATPHEVMAIIEVQEEAHADAG